MISATSSPGSVTYLEHEEASVGSFKIFGSPYAHWGGHNDAFMCTEDNIYAGKATHMNISQASV